LLDTFPVSINAPIRHRLLTVLFLGVITSGLSLVALVRLLSTTTQQRVERARDNVAEEASLLAAEHTSAIEKPLEIPPRSAVIGMRGGYVDLLHPRSNAPEAWRPTVDRALREAAAGDRIVVLDAPITEATVVVGARRASDGGVAWAAYPVRTPPYLDTWRWIVMALSLATLLLAVSAVHAVITFRRSAAGLNAALGALARDLSAPVPSPPVRELKDIAEGIATLARNLAQSREAQERMGRELARQERLAALGRVVAGVAHEVRNPLASIKLRLDLAAGAGTLTPAVEQAISHASAEIARLDRLVADLLVVAGRSLGPRRKVSLGALVRERAEALSPWAQLRRVSLDVSGTASAEIDPDSIARAFDNLARNAIEASPAGATVSVKIGGDGQGAKIQVDDRGQGVAGARAAELFEPFFTTKADGTGLGLAISRALARAHGGDVVYQRLGEITRFELTLPRSAPPSQDLHRAAS
jgi:signal transduction histidine kinase